MKVGVFLFTQLLVAPVVRYEWLFNYVWWKSKVVCTLLSVGNMLPATGGGNSAAPTTNSALVKKDTAGSAIAATGGALTSPRNNAWTPKSGAAAAGSFTSTAWSSAPSLREHLDAPNANRRRSSHESAASSDDGDEDIIDVEIVDPSLAVLGSQENRQVAWQCGTCKYCMLAIDHKGKTLPLSLNAWGQPISLQCPRCLVSHSNWTVASPFDSYGDHVNVKGTFANSLHFRQDGGGAAVKPPLTPTPPSAAATSAISSVSMPGNNVSSGGTLLENLPPILQSIGLVTYRGGEARSTVVEPPPQRKQRTAYFCGLCNRRLLRMDHNGDLVPLDTNAGGEILPLTCPGCGVSHGDWPIRTS
jgi:hypothetical protein